MSPKTGRPPIENPKDKGYRLRVSSTDLEKLDYSCKVLGAYQGRDNQARH